MKKIALILLAAVALTACGKQAVKLYDAAAFQQEEDGRQIALYTLQNSNGMAVQISNYGARIVSLWAPDKKGGFRNVVLGFDNLDDYMTPEGRFEGATLGRYAGLIGGSRFTLDEVEYTLPANDNGNQLNGGQGGFHARVWEAVQAKDAQGNDCLTLSYTSPAGEMGYPGELNAEVIYTLTVANKLQIDYRATCDTTTVVNLANQISLNLRGAGRGSAFTSGAMLLHANRYLATGEGLVPTGKITTIEEGSTLDFSNYKLLRGSEDEIDQTFVLRKAAFRGDLEGAASFYEPETGIMLDILTTQTSLRLRPGKEIVVRAANYPDAPNLRLFPSAVLRAGETYRETTVYAFSIRK